MSEKTKKCSFCAETIKAEAIVCRFCGRDLLDSEKSKQSNNSKTSNSPPKVTKSKFWTIAGLIVLCGVMCSCVLIMVQTALRLPEQPTISQNTIIPSATASRENGADIIQEITPEPTALPTDLPTSTPTIAPTSSPTSAPPPTPVPLAYAIVTTNANLRSGPGTSYDIVGSASTGTALSIYGMTDDGWYQIDLEGQAWIGSSLVRLEEIEPTTVASSSSTLVATSTATLPPRTYRWIDVEDASYGSVKRFGVKTVTSFPILRREVREICSEVLEEFKTRYSFNAVIIYIYEEGTDTSWVFNIAACHYAPGGKWEDANLVQTGDYSTHQFSYRYADRVNR